MNDMRCTHQKALAALNTWLIQAFTADDAAFIAEEYNMLCEQLKAEDAHELDRVICETASDMAKKRLERERKEEPAKLGDEWPDTDLDDDYWSKVDEEDIRMYRQQHAAELFNDGLIIPMR